jgi:hypothetical protein
MQAGHASPVEQFPMHSHCAFPLQKPDRVQDVRPSSKFFPRTYWNAESFSSRTLCICVCRRRPHRLGVWIRIPRIRRLRFSIGPTLATLYQARGTASLERSLHERNRNGSRERPQALAEGTRVVAIPTRSNLEGPLRTDEATAKRVWALVHKERLRYSQAPYTLKKGVEQPEVLCSIALKWAIQDSNL